MQNDVLAGVVQRLDWAIRLHQNRLDECKRKENEILEEKTMILAHISRLEDERSKTLYKAPHAT